MLRASCVRSVPILAMMVAAVHAVSPPPDKASLPERVSTGGGVDADAFPLDLLGTVFGHRGARAESTRGAAKEADQAEGDESSAGGIVLAIVGGFLSASGANCMAWSEHQVRTSGREWSPWMQRFFVGACLFLNLSGILAFVLSTSAGGAVTTVMPMQTGSNLLSNMLLQTTLGLKYFTKSMRVGTLVLICAVAELSELGPKSPAQPDVAELMAQPKAVAWILALLGLTAFAIWGARRTQHLPLESVPKLCFMTSVVTLTTVIGVSVSKCFVPLGDSGQTGFLVLAFLGYAIDGVICLYSTVVANQICDVSLYIPLQLSSQLVVNMFTGFFIWNDADYIDRPVSYLLVYVLAILGVYMISPDLDLVGQLLRKRHLRRSALSDGQASTSIGKAALELLQAWRTARGSRTTIDGTTEQACREAVDTVLLRGREEGAITEGELRTLVLRLLSEHGLGPSAAVVQWLETDVSHFRRYLEQDPLFAAHLRETLSSEEHAKLAASVGPTGSTCTDGGASSQLLAGAPSVAESLP